MLNESRAALGEKEKAKVYRELRKDLWEKEMEEENEKVKTKEKKKKKVKVGREARKEWREKKTNDKVETVRASTPPKIYTLTNSAVEKEVPPSIGEFEKKDFVEDDEFGRIDANFVFDDRGNKDQYDESYFEYEDGGNKT
ncbi:uncharacterized protein A4U43_C08F25600 [Asparagus officinalis]|nr:uncharacterized protein A4U43_C08F25600 [Asparagus officinalis]